MKWFLVSFKFKSQLIIKIIFIPHVIWWFAKKEIMIAVDNTRNCTIFSLFLFYLTGTVCTLHKNIKNSRISVKLQGYWTWTLGEVRCFSDLNSKRISRSSYFSTRQFDISQQIICDQNSFWFSIFKNHHLGSISGWLLY